MIEDGINENAIARTNTAKMLEAVSCYFLSLYGTGQGVIITLKDRLSLPVASLRTDSYMYSG